MRKLLMIAFLFPVCCTALVISPGCTGKKETTVVEPPEIDEAAEEAQNAADDEVEPS